jgi:hypothetical protein
MFLPLALVAALRWASPRLHLRWRRAAYLVPVALVAGVALTASRSAEVGVAAAAILIVLATGAPRRLTTVVFAGLFFVLLVAFVDGSLIGSPFSAAAHSDSISVRLQRLPTLFALVVHRPFTGLGYSGLFGSLPGLDDAYALLYGTIGVIGLAAWGVMLVTTGATVTRALRARVGSDTRDLGAACLVGIVAVIVAGAAYDLVATPQSQWAFMILAALAVAVAEGAPKRVPARRWWAARATLPVAGVAGGFLLLAAAPVASAQSAAVFLTSPQVIASSQAPVDAYTGKVLINTVCGFLTGPGETLPGTTLTCSGLTEVSPGLWPMLAVVRITGPDPASVRAEYAHTLGRFRSVLPAEITRVGAVDSGKPAWATTAPVWMGLTGLVAMFLIPALTRRPWRPRREWRGSRREVSFYDGHEPGAPGPDEAARPSQRVGERTHLVSVAHSSGDGEGPLVPHEGPHSPPALR